MLMARMSQGRTLCLPTGTSLCLSAMLVAPPLPKMAQKLSGLLDIHDSSMP